MFSLTDNLIDLYPNSTFKIREKFIQKSGKEFLQISIGFQNGYTHVIFDATLSSFTRLE